MSRQILLIGTLILLVIGGGVFVYSNQEEVDSSPLFRIRPMSKEAEKEDEELVTTEFEPIIYGGSSSSFSSSASSTTSPSQTNLEVPFSSQAPHGNWDAPYQEACEEVSLIMVDHYLRNQPLDQEAADAAIQSLVQWETRNGLAEDITIDQLAWIARNYYGYKAEVIDEVSYDRIITELQKGNPIIVPAAGRMLGNPYFSGEGPWYHMLVITGYDETHFIVNDPGTKRGAGYRYDFLTLLNAIHDWNGQKRDIGAGIKRMLILKQNSILD